MRDSRAYNIARMKGANHQEAEDFCQWIQLRRLEGYNTDYPQLKFVDFLREKEGDVRAQWKKDLKLIQYSEKRDDRSTPPAEPWEADKLFSEAGLKPRDYEFAILFWVWGYGAEEIGFMYDISWQRVYYRLSRVKIKLHNYLKEIDVL